MFNTGKQQSPAPPNQPGCHIAVQQVAKRLSNARFSMAHPDRMVCFIQFFGIGERTAGFEVRKHRVRYGPQYFLLPRQRGAGRAAAEESALCKSEYTEWSPRISSESEDPKRNSVSKVHPGVQLRILFQSSNSLSRIPCWTVCKTHGRSLVSRYSRSLRTVSLRNCEPLHSAL